MIAARSGHIINISSLAGRNPLPKGAAYAASKWGLNGLTYSVAEELRQFNIRVSVVAPGSINGFQRPLRQGRCFRKGSEKEAPTRRYCLSCCDPGGAITAVFYQ
jgi:NAD(P)-dependent dehydrogenase (short-subunit alcohol dehydrogenase family)